MLFTLTLSIQYSIYINKNGYTMHLTSILIYPFNRNMSNKTVNLKNNPYCGQQSVFLQNICCRNTPVSLSVIMSPLPFMHALWSVPYAL